MCICSLQLPSYKFYIYSYIYKKYIECLFNKNVIPFKKSLKNAGGKRINITRELQLLQVLKVYLKWEKRFSEEV